MAVAQGEELCRSYRETSGSNTVVLRFDHLYGEPKKERQEENPCFQMMLEALKTGKISANSRNVFSLLYMSDAVEFTYQIRRKHYTDGTGKTDSKVCGDGNGTGGQYGGRGISPGIKYRAL